MTKGSRLNIAPVHLEDFVTSSSNTHSSQSNYRHKYSFAKPTIVPSHASNPQQNEDVLIPLNLGRLLGNCSLRRSCHIHDKSSREGRRVCAESRNRPNEGRGTSLTKVRGQAFILLQQGSELQRKDEVCQQAKSWRRQHRVIKRFQIRQLRQQ